MVERVDHPPWHALPASKLWIEIGARGTDITDQLPIGDFTPGRYAWLLTDITPCDPVPAKGRQVLWEWEGVAV